MAYAQRTSPFNDDTSLCFVFNVGYHTLLGIGDRSIYANCNVKI